MFRARPGTLIVPKRINSTVFLTAGPLCGPPVKKVQISRGPRPPGQGSRGPRGPHSLGHCRPKEEYFITCRSVKCLTEGRIFYTSTGKICNPTICPLVGVGCKGASNCVIKFHKSRCRILMKLGTRVLSNRCTDKHLKQLV